MGMYSQLKLSVNLKSDGNLVDILDFMMSIREHKNPYVELTLQEGIALNHPLFSTERWTWMLRGYSEYFSEWEEPSFTYEKTPGTDKKYIHFTCYFSIKNYTNEIQNFLDFLSPYAEDKEGSLVGTLWYEGYDNPVMIKVINGAYTVTKDIANYESEDN